MSIDLSEIGHDYNNYLGLNLDDSVCRALNAAYFSSKHLIEKGKKTTVRKFEQKLDKVTEQALQLSETLSSLESTYRDCLSFSLKGQHGISIDSQYKIVYFIQSLAKAAQTVKEVKLKPIPNGFYNAFIFKGVDNLLSFLSFSINFAIYLSVEKIEPTQDTAKDFLLNFWVTNNLTERVKVTAVNVIMTNLSASSKDIRVAQKAVDKYLVSIVNERIKNKANLLIKSHNRMNDNKSKLRQGNN